MPLVDSHGHRVFRCINNHWKEDQTYEPLPADPEQRGRSKEPPKTTMEALPDWGFITRIHSPSTPGAMPIVMMREGTPLRIYRCRLCGYVEMYTGDIIAPEVWGPDVNP